MNNIVRPVERTRGWDVFGDFDDVMGNWFRAPVTARRGDAARSPAIDVSETEGAYLVKAELPGVSRDGLDVTIKDGVLTINAERNEEKKRRKRGSTDSPRALLRKICTIAAIGFGCGRIQSRGAV